MNPAFIVNMIIMDGLNWLQHRLGVARHCFRNGLAVTIFVGFALLSNPQDAGAYVSEAHTWPSNSTILLQLGLGTPNHALQDGSPTWNAAASPALTMWNQQMQRVHFTGVVNPSPPVASGDGVNSVVFSTTVFGQAFGAGTLAVTYYRWQGANFVESDVLFNSAQNFDSYRGPIQYGPNYYAIGDIRRILLHELGHVLGLNHPDSAGQQVDAVMNSFVSNRETLSPDDIAGVQSMYGAPVPPPVSSSTSLLWQNNQTGERQIWSMNGTVHTGTSSLGFLSTQWNMATSADFNGDGKTDIVLQNSVTGQRVVWMMNGTTHVSSVILPTVAPDWKIVAASDFNGDGKADILWQNGSGVRSIWLMNGTVRTGIVSLGFVDYHWNIVGSGDFNGDGKADILWQHKDSGMRSLWLMNGTVRASIVNLGTVDKKWDIVGTGDFNGDGKADIVWQHKDSGMRSIWLMNGTVRSGIVNLGTVAIPWNIRNY
jgi:hypothetical protein